MELQFAQPQLAHLIWGFACSDWPAWSRHRAHSAAQQLVSLRLQPKLASAPSGAVGCCSCLPSRLWELQEHLLDATPIAGPGFSEKWACAGGCRVVLDLSKSMRLRTLPSRLERAKSEILELSVQLSGYRLGLVGFAGRASVLCPLTTDLGFFSLALNNADPSSISRGGTRIGEAIRTAVKAFGPGQSPRLMLLITDGEDHDSYPKEAAEAAKELGIHIVSIGFGSEQGSQITLTDPETGAKSALRDRDGQVVLSKLDGETLRELALMTDGAYVPAGTAALDLESIVNGHITPMVLADAVDATMFSQRSTIPSLCCCRCWR